MDITLIGLVVLGPLDLPPPAVDVASLLRAVPGVAQVEVRVAVAKPKQRLIHFRDFHYEGYDRIKSYSEHIGRPLTDEQAKAANEVHLKLIEEAQDEHDVILRRLVGLGLRTVCQEGWTKATISTFKNAVPRVRWGMQQPRGRLDVRTFMVRCGVAGRLAADRLVDVLPLEEKAGIVPFEVGWGRGRWWVAPEAYEARHDANVRQVIATGRSTVVVILGAAHDLTAAVQRANADIEYIAVTTARVQELPARWLLERMR